MPYLALKIDVDTLRGTREGVPRLVDLLQRHRAGATFLFSLGPDHTGRAIRRVFRPGFLTKVSRTSVVEHYGIRQLLYGTLLPGPDIGRRCAPIMRRVAEQGFEVGIHTWDHIRWQDQVQGKNAAWTRREMQQAVDRFTDIFGLPARTHGAAGWQMNPHAYRLEAAFGFDYCSDTRGAAPFLPVFDDGTTACPQLPTTLPTLDELIGVAGHDASECVDYLLRLTAEDSSSHVYTLHAELEGMKLAPAFEQLLEGWRAQGYTLSSVRTYFETLPVTTLPRHAVTLGTVPGRSGTLALQGVACATEAALPAASVCPDNRFS
jgi:peptidoglycan/xylan/chitin deacetylase (PgdA/CDA1 family)